MKQTLYLAGDSTMADYPSKSYPMQGWGNKLHLFIPDSVSVVNKAMCGRNSKSFIEEGRLDEIIYVIRPKDYLFIQFGHNDSKEDVERHTVPWSTYHQYLRQYIDETRAAGAYPVLISPLCRRHFDVDGLLINTHGDYPRSMEALAALENVPFIDLCGRSAVAFKEMGEARSKQWLTWLSPGEHPNYPEGIQDNTHLNEPGAEAVAQMVADAIFNLMLNIS
ncbi:rhamnogalacturonan acetylesterase [Paenibacillus sp. Soil750]|uniref:rhamnogalacturonan acetylesterase n=1 Tax=Paenibacillus sp. Soil750 TaxID=1736398 RepID=UPI0006FD3CB3|nr:rhamnogalacturonan acetylesterase [Paenibacillus sp. Soil750]KRE70166.1 rhamnogalacturonan acetylesterase [Paenibacillus sp. Soil750]